jgi:hypothetical protein
MDLIEKPADSQALEQILRKRRWPVERFAFETACRPAGRPYKMGVNPSDAQDETNCLRSMLPGSPKLGPVRVSVPSPFRFAVPPEPAVAITPGLMFDR